MIANAPEPTYRGGLGLRDPKVTITLTETLDPPSDRETQTIRPARQVPPRSRLRLMGR
jgi:hypothetical protein